MKLIKIYVLFIGIFLIMLSCSDNDSTDYPTREVRIKLVYPNDYETVEGVNITLLNRSTTAKCTTQTNADGEAIIHIATGIYEVSTTDNRAVGASAFVLNGQANVVIGDDWVSSVPLEMNLTASRKGQIVIKELYVGGCQKNNGSGKFQMDSYVILYNNSDIELNLENTALAIATPSNSTTSNKYYTDGKLSYEAEGWIPASTAIWYFKNVVSMAPGEEIVIALKNAVDNTITYSNSINFAHEEYYCTYDVSGQFNNVSYYPSPASVIPVSHHLLAAIYGKGNAWAISSISPAFFIFTTPDITPLDFASDATNQEDYFGSSATISLRVPVEWILDGVEVKGQGIEGLKRLTAKVDAGYINMINGYGYSMYRNVDKEATEAIETNADKLVYNYNLGTTDQKDGTTDPSEIDAEASIKNGARIIYQDTNNSTNDFHQRSRASLRDN